MIALYDRDRYGLTIQLGSNIGRRAVYFLAYILLNPAGQDRIMGRLGLHALCGADHPDSIIIPPTAAAATALCDCTSSCHSSY